MCGIFAFKGNSIPISFLQEQFMKLKHRGPDNTNFSIIDNDVILGFHRLSIMDLSTRGNQPFDTRLVSLLCNGEIYNYESLKNKFSSFNYASESDCEVLLPMIIEVGLEATCKQLDAEFAFIFYDHRFAHLCAARDPIGIRPLFWGRTNAGEIAFASEAKALINICGTVEPFPPGHLWDGKHLIKFHCLPKEREEMGINEALDGIEKKLKIAVKKRLRSDAEIGCLLSGGLDSSLVCAMIAPIRTFSIGSEIDGIDNEYAERVAAHIGSEHTTIYLSEEEVFNSLDHLIYALETWDTTTIRASIGMYLVSKWIRENTNIKVLLTGDVSDELFGYKYTDYAPSSVEFQKESIKRIKEVYMYDVLRGDRCLAANSIEVRVPFADLDFVNHVVSIPASLKMNTYGKGKYLLRKVFEGLLPKDLLYREKEAFSDGVGHSVADGIAAYAEKTISDGELEVAKNLYKHGTPLFKEALLYRRIFERHYPGRAGLIKDFWLPNKNWPNCNVVDPSARVLPNYSSVI